MSRAHPGCEAQVKSFAIRKAGQSYTLSPASDRAARDPVLRSRAAAAQGLPLLNRRTKENAHGIT